MNPSRKKVLGVLAAIGIPAAAIGGLSIGQADALVNTGDRQLVHQRGDQRQHRSRTR